LNRAAETTGKDTDTMADEGANTSGWMLTFSDLVMLLLTFFVLLLSMSSMDDKRLKDIFANFTDATGVLALADLSEIGDMASFITAYNDTDTMVVVDKKSLMKWLLPADALHGELKELADGIEDKIDVKDDERGLVLTFYQDILFEPGSVSLNASMFPILDSVAKAILHCTNDIWIMGHADASPVNSGRYASNWELSAYRALAVMEYLTDQHHLAQQRFSVGGYGSSRPLNGNQTPEARALNRRVEVIFRTREAI